MIYMGSKRRIAKHILPIMIAEADKLGITRWVEPFAGGANVIDKVPNRFRRVGYDLNEHVICALKDIRDRASDLPGSISEEYYRSIKGRPPAVFDSWLRIVCSFGAKLDAGYARRSGSDDTTYATAGKRNAQKQSPLIQGVDFIHADYRDLSFSDSLIYCDPPYQGTSGHKTGEFDHGEFFEWCREQAKRNIVFVSEYDSPFTEVWRGEIKTNFSSSRKKATHNAVEKLFRV